MFDPRKHNYYRKLIQLVRKEGAPGGVAQVAVCHDDWCRIYQGDTATVIRR